MNHIKLEQIDWKNIKIEYITQDFQEQEQKFSVSLSGMEYEQDHKQDQMDYEDCIVFDPEELIEEVYDEDQQVPQTAFQTTLKRSSEDESGVLYYCNTCSLDFPSVAYLKRHYSTKKHQRALQMEVRGRKFAQRRKYVRKNVVSASTIKTVTDLTPEEKKLLHVFDEQLSKIQDEKSAKDFYENFNFDLDLDETVQTEAVPMRLQSPEDILADLIQSSEKFLQNNNDSHCGLRISSVYEVKPQTIVYDVHAPPAKKQYIEYEEKPKHFCSQCNKTFNLQCHFTQHMNIVHAGDRKYKCQTCGKKYPEKHMLDTHMAKHFEQNKQFRCLQCPRAYNNKVDLKRHEKTHQEVKDHVCNICGNGFVRFDHLQKHYAVHQKRMSMGLGDRIRSRRGLPIKQEAC